MYQDKKIFFFTVLREYITLILYQDNSLLLYCFKRIHYFYTATNAKSFLLQNAKTNLSKIFSNTVESRFEVLETRCLFRIISSSNYRVITINVCNPNMIIISYYQLIKHELCVWLDRSGSVVKCLTRDRRAAGSSLTGVTALWSLSKTHLS